MGLNNYSPVGAVLQHLGYIKHTEDELYPVSKELEKSLRTQVIQAPRHGILFFNETRSTTLPGNQSWMYHGNPGYEGIDQAVFRVEADKQVFEVTVNYLVHDVVVENRFHHECESRQSGTLNLD